MAPTNPYFLTAIAAIGLGTVTDAFGAESWVVVVRAGAHDRIDTPVRTELEGARAEQVRADRPSLSTGPKPFLLQEVRDDGNVLDPFVAQVEDVPHDSGGAVRLTWILKGTTAAGTERRFRPAPSGAATADPAGPWALSDPKAG